MLHCGWIRQKPLTPYSLYQWLKNIRKTYASVSSAIMWAKSFQQYNLDAHDFVLLHLRWIRLRHDWITLSKKKSKTLKKGVCRCPWVSLTVVATASVNITKEGKEALLRLSNGDMRRALNILQACHAAFDRIDDTAIYTCTGYPHPKDIQRIVDTMMNDDFTTAYSSMDCTAHIFASSVVVCC